MENTAKDFARSSWRASQQRSGRNKKYHKPQKSEVSQNLGSNFDRFEEPTSPKPGDTPIPQSQGLDFAKKLAEPKKKSSTYFLSRRWHEEEVEKHFPTSALDLQKHGLSINFAQLYDMLLSLPESDVLGITDDFITSDEIKDASLAKSNERKHIYKYRGVLSTSKKFENMSNQMKMPVLNDQLMAEMNRSEEPHQELAKASNAHEYDIKMEKVVQNSTKLNDNANTLETGKINKPGIAKHSQADTSASGGKQQTVVDNISSKNFTIKKEAPKVFTKASLTTKPATKADVDDFESWLDS